jgi:hypothetical protein
MNIEHISTFEFVIQKKSNEINDSGFGTLCAPFPG